MQVLTVGMLGYNNVLLHMSKYNNKIKGEFYYENHECRGI
ncbi:hypothetical protein SpAn4DRAFT_5075 [Sporomusa ovata]|uniref:Uncharacterized protein n=1 Tax=Sporomusa ovata TaxID=2378 RepID=A0A0U1KXU0_9FIRM|nr:hypothetical protein SpAn4DRAFT_5075 [Sporomusa ovata]